MAVYNPVSTYRIQFHKDFTLEDARKILLYLHKTGIRTIYASPVFQAVKGSMHGYDVTDPSIINREIGSVQNFRELIRALHRKGMGWIQDFVPNHMAYSVENPWIYDVLQKGSLSAYYEYFDIFFDHPEKILREKIMLPFFGSPINEILKNGELSIFISKSGFSFRYFKDEYPLSIPSYSNLLTKYTDKPIPERLQGSLHGIISKHASPDSIGQLFIDYVEDPGAANHINHCLDLVNASQDLMKEVVDEQHFLPVYWKETEKKINFRRFFTINGLICLNIQKDKVYDSYHKLLVDWLDSNLIDGVRIDHVDGMYDPAAYLEKLRQTVGRNRYLVVEKILEKGEKLPENWPVQGTTGYDFLSMVNNLLTNENNKILLHDFSKEWGNENLDFKATAINAKRYFLYHRLKGELDILTWQGLKLKPLKRSGFGEDELRVAIAEFLVYCPVYKLYNAPSFFSKDDKELLENIFSSAMAGNPKHKKALKGLHNVFLVKSTDSKEDTEKVNAFFRRCMQFTGPLMAKGIEDTTFYSYNAFLAHNEVGDSPGYFGITKKTFHQLMMDRIRNNPLSMNATATHDTKRGEDARARLNVLSDLPERWMEMSRKWREMNRPFKEIHHGMEIPSGNDEYYIYQSLCAHLPMDGLPDPDFIARFKGSLVKAVREAKINSSWSEPDLNYEQNMLAFVSKILNEKSDFTFQLHSFVKELIPHGIINSITQVILKNTLPGIPDTFQGSEIWNLNFVDPDNRRPVDYSKLSRDLNNMIREHKKDPAALLKRLYKGAENGKLKQWLNYLTLQERFKANELFTRGSYLPLSIKGKYKDHLIAFYRVYRNDHLIVVLPLNTAVMKKEGHWHNTRIKLPCLVPPVWENIFTGYQLDSSGELEVAHLFNILPFAVIKGMPRQPEKRAGILMHISSLPGKYGIGDFGPEARKFISFLENSGQHYWQILPLSITNKLTDHSPYSSYSAFAGNPLFIDPYHLFDEGLIGHSELKKHAFKSKNRVKFNRAEQVKKHYIDRAYKTFRNTGRGKLRSSFEDFILKEQYWLPDFALYVNLKKHFNNQPWITWPEKYRERDSKSLDEFYSLNQYEIEKVQFCQFIFSRQWMGLKSTANDKSIDIFGDIPIYIDYDSADVWSHPELFHLKPDKTMAGVAGVPPDYFNETGQLWGMPLFNWESMAKDGYAWWLNRLGKNLEWFDLLRLDHFRGFSAYWEVPPDAENALNGKWVEGPGKKFFDAIRKRFHEMPFVAEDLGKIDQPVYDLRDEFGLPGMKIVQFGFGENMPFLGHNPMNYQYHSVAYTGTHDNNTVKGWIRQETDEGTHNRIKHFQGKELSVKYAHRDMIRSTYASNSRLVIIPMQDWLGLDENSRMNFPSTTEGNWMWKMKAEDLTRKLEKQIREQVKTFGRY